MYSSFFVTASKSNQSMQRLLNFGTPSFLEESSTTLEDDQKHMCHIQPIHHRATTPLYGQLGSICLSELEPEPQELPRLSPIYSTSPCRLKLIRSPSPSPSLCPESPEDIHQDREEITDNAKMIEFASSSFCTSPPDTAPLDYGYSRMTEMTDATSTIFIDVDDNDDDDNYNDDSEFEFSECYSSLSTPRSSICSNSSSESVPLFDLVMHLGETEEQILMAQRGYNMNHKICDTLQGVLRVLCS